MGAGRAQPRQARGGAGAAGERVAGRSGPGPDRGRRGRPRRAGRRRRGRPRGHHHGRALRPLWRADRRRLCRRRDRLRRSHRRAGVRRPHVARPPRRGGADRRPPGPLLRLRLDPARPRRLLHGPAVARGGAAEGRRLRPLRRQLLRRDLPLGDQRLRPGAADDRRRQRASPWRAAAARSRDPLGLARHPPRRRVRRLDRAAADDRRPHRPPLRRRPRPLRAELHLWPPHGRQAPGDDRGAGGRGGDGRPAGGAPADPQAAAEDQIPRRGARRCRARQELVQGQVRGGGRRQSASSPRSPAATPVTARPRRCWPSRPSASPSTTSRRPPAR